jgi:hypothetical protein
MPDESLGGGGAVMHSVEGCHKQGIASNQTWAVPLLIPTGLGGLPPPIPVGSEGSSQLCAAAATPPPVLHQNVSTEIVTKRLRYVGRVH